MWLGAGYLLCPGAKLLTASPTLVKPSRWAMSFTEVPGGLKSLGAVATWLTL